MNVAFGLHGVKRVKALQNRAKRGSPQRFWQGLRHQGQALFQLLLGRAPLGNFGLQHIQQIGRIRQLLRQNHRAAREFFCRLAHVGCGPLQQVIQIF